MAIMALVLISLLMILVVDASSLASPTIPLGGSSSNGKPGLTGALVVCLFSNVNETNPLALPGTGPLLGISQKAMRVTQANVSAPTSIALFTTTRGGVEQNMAPGSYVISLQDESLSIRIPIQIQQENVTTVEVRVHGSAFSVQYSEQSGVLLTPGGVQSGVYVQLNSSTPVASTGEPVIVKVLGQTQSSGQTLNATVVSQEPPSQGTQWLQLGTAARLNPVDATSIYMTTWSDSLIGPTISPIEVGGVSADACP